MARTPKPYEHGVVAEGSAPPRDRYVAWVESWSWAATPQDAAFAYAESIDRIAQAVRDGALPGPQTVRLVHFGRIVDERVLDAT